MKGSCPRITLLGSNSGNNLGDAAILSSILEHLTRELPTAEFFVPTTKPSFVRTHYSQKYNVKAVDMMPWTGSIRFLGIPTIRCLMQSDIALICDGIIFGKKLFNPFFNFLITLLFVVPIARMVGCKVVCYSCGIGPFPSWWSRIFARSVVNGCDLVIMREHDSRRLAESIGVTQPIEVTGDAAFINSVSSDERGREVAVAEGIDLSKPLLGINVTKYFDAWLAASEKLADRHTFLDLLASAINDARRKIGTDIEVVVFSTHPMDEAPVRELAAKVQGKVITNSSYLSHDIQAVMRNCQLFMGMRFHSVVLASAVEAPVIGLIYMMKVRGFMRLLGCEEYALELSQLTKENLSEKLVKAWHERAALKTRQKKVIDELKAGALRAARTIRERFYPEIQAPKAAPEIRTAVGE